MSSRLPFGPGALLVLFLGTLVGAAIGAGGPYGPLAHTAVPFNSVPVSSASEAGVGFANVTGNQWWVQTRVSTAGAAPLTSVQAMDSEGAWRPMQLQPWSDCDCWWATSFHVEPGHLVRLRATLAEGLAVDSCPYEHPSGVEQCGALLLDPSAPEPLAGPTAPAGSGQLMVGFAHGSSPRLAVGETLVGLTVLASIPQIDVLVLAAPQPALAAQALAGMPDVLYVEADAAAKSLATPNDPRYGLQYGSGLSGFPAAWTATQGSPNVTVAVLDSGITRTHPDFAGSRILAGRDYVNRDGTPNDDCGHGTHVTGILAARTNNGVGMAGSSQATILPLKVLGANCSGSLSNIAQAIVDATDQKADIVTMSFGTTTDSKSVASAVSYAWSRGTLLVAAAGNGGADNTVHYPAAYPQVIAVSAVDSAKILAPYSSRGAQVDIAAAGTRIDSTTNNGGYGSMSGTSMAAPLVAGALALAASCAPQVSPDELRAALAATAEDLGPAGRDNRFGDGLLRVDLMVATLCPSTSTVNHVPVASFGHRASGLAVDFDGRASVDADGDALSYSWTFGDGTSGEGQAPSHLYSAAATYLVNLTVSDGRLSSTHSAAVAVLPATFSPLFSPAKGSNEWWIEVAVAGGSNISSVAVSVGGGTWQTLPRTSWGTWASSLHAQRGSNVTFQATNSAGDVARSATYTWLGPAPAPGPFTAVFTPRTLSNPWWVEVEVAASEPVALVEVRLDSGNWTNLPATSWGTWARSVHVLPGTQVVFRATAPNGVAVLSATYVWR